MPLLRQVLVYETALHGKVTKAIDDSSADLIFRHEGNNSCLVVITSRNEIGQSLLSKKIPQKAFRLLWIDDEGDFSRIGKFVDNAYGTAFAVTEQLEVRPDEFERIQRAYEKDRFISLCQTDPTLRTRYSIEFAAAQYAASYEVFLSAVVARDAGNDYLKLTVYYPLNTSYEAASPGEWIGLLDKSKEYQSSLGAHFAVDTDDWWSHNQRGIVSEVSDSLCANLAAKFNVDCVDGFISAHDVIVDGRSIE
jgi:hypothetical protein